MANPNYLSGLSPEQIQQLMGNGFGPNWTGSFSQDGAQYNPTYQESVDDPTNRKLLGFTGTDPNHMKPGDLYNLYGTGGGNAGLQKILNGNTPGSPKDLLQAVAYLGAFALGGNALGGALAGAGGAAAGAGDMGMGSWGAGGLGGAGGAGADFGLSAGGAGAGALGAGSGAAIDGGGMALGGGDAAEADLGMNGVGNVDNYALSQGAPASLGAGYLSSGSAAFGLSDLGSLALKYGPALLGGLLGSKPVQSSTSRDLPPEMKPYVYGQGGLLPGAASLFQKQTAPGALQGFTDMQNVGQGLLNQPIAGNGFAQFQAMPRFGAPRR